MKIELNKKYRYRNGDLARVLCVDAPGSQKVVTIDSSGGLHQHWDNGAYALNSSITELDLIEVREPLECWVRVKDDEEKVDEMFTPAGERLNPKWRLFREVID